MKTTIIRSLLFVLLITLVSSCENQKKETGIVGLWLVEKVQVGENSMTPISKWTQFNADSTHTSGNGWLQHSYGNWSLKKNQLKVTDKDGIIDPAEPFTIEVKENKMTWKRNEEGQEITVFLKRIDKLPKSEGNKLIGLWKLTKATDDGNDITVMVNPDDKSIWSFSIEEAKLTLTSTDQKSVMEFERIHELIN